MRNSGRTTIALIRLTLQALESERVITYLSVTEAASRHSHMTFLNLFKHTLCSEIGKDFVVLLNGSKIFFKSDRYLDERNIVGRKHEFFRDHTSERWEPYLRHYNVNFIE